MNYIEIGIHIENNTEETRDIICAMLGSIGFESFSDIDSGVNAYIQKNEFSEQLLKDTLEPLKDLLGNYNFSAIEIEQKNWNEEWEKNFEPIFIDQKCCIRAPFHKAPENYEFDIVIEPKMSFGTGHHATTSGMIRLMLDLDLQNKTVLDMGCGTGVLAILASLKKAKPITGIDIDNWAYQNSIENAERNNCNTIEFLEGNAGLLKGKLYDIILANINRNILIADMKTYVSSLKNGGKLLLSGFYVEDLTIIKEKAELLGLHFETQLETNNWLAVQFKK